MITFGRGLSPDVGALRVHWYASVSKATCGNSSSSAAAMALTAFRSAPIGEPSLRLIARSAASLHWLPLSFCEMERIEASGWARSTLRACSVINATREAFDQQSWP